MQLSEELRAYIRNEMTPEMRDEIVMLIETSIDRRTAHLADCIAIRHGWAVSTTPEQWQQCCREARDEQAKKTVEAKSIAAQRAEDARKQAERLCTAVKAAAETMRCNCDLDNWEPERRTGHSHVCRIHKAALQAVVA